MINEELLKRLAIFLNETPDIIKEHQVLDVAKSGIHDEDASYMLLLKEFLDFSFDYSKIVKKENPIDYINNPYYKNIKISNKKFNNWTLKYAQYKPYELFVRDDFKEIDDNVYPSLGYFDKPFKYIAVYESNRLWMSITPNEINTMEKSIEEANGNVLVVGLGLGYYSYMVSLKDNVSNITIIEKDINVIKLFNKVLLNQFKYKEKIRIINEDVYEYFKNNDLNQYDYIFVDIYHDVSDGLDVYKKLSKTTNALQNTKTRYWIEDTMKYYL